MRKKYFYLIALVFSIQNSPLFSVETHDVTGLNNKTIFQLRFHNKGEKFNNFETGSNSTRNFLESEKKSIISASEYWAGILKNSNTSPGIINIGTYDEANAYAVSSIEEDGMTKLQEKILGLNSDMAEIDAKIGIGTLDFKSSDPYPVPNLGGTDLYGTMVHEIGHALGISSTAGLGKNEETGKTVAYFEGSNFDAHLVDSSGKKSIDTTGMIHFIGKDGTVYGDKNTDFDATGDVYFVGENVSEVLENSNSKGILINSVVETDAPELSHLELDRGLMSHQAYRNYSTFMEAELAVLQDIGYNIDRRDFFGYSVYGDNLVLDNNNGYYSRDKNGEHYVKSEYNTADYGMGLHIYGDNNQITQKEDLLSKGTAGVGIRVDGVGNTVVIDKGVKVHGNGDFGAGVLVAYGKSHRLEHKGEIQGNGKNGIGVLFDFGTGLLGADTAYEGSYILSGNQVDQSHKSNIDGALVDYLDISGSIQGNYASLYMSENAYVENINILDGAKLAGDIYSFYAPKIEAGKDGAITTRPTETNIYFQAENFSFDDNISGNNIVLNFESGKSILNGKNEIRSVNISSNGFLGGNGYYKIAQDKTFSNDGTISPGNSLGKLTLEGSYIQKSGGELELEFDGKGEKDIFEVLGNTTFESGAKASLVPLKSYYSQETQLNINSFVKVSGTATGTIDNFELDTRNLKNSLTIDNITFDEDSSAMIIKRKNNAYSSLTEDEKSREFAQVLDKISPNANGEIKEVIGELDFSDQNTAVSGLSQITPALYGNKIINSLDQGHQITSYITDHMNQDYASYENNNLYSFGRIFYRGAWQDGASKTASYDASNNGVVAGIEKATDTGLIIGTHVVYKNTNLKGHTESNASVKGKGVEFGINSYYTPAKSKNSYLYGLIRGGFEKNELNKKLSFGQYSNTVNTNWKAFNMSAMAGIGKNYKYDNYILSPIIELEYGLVKNGSINDNTLGINIDSDLYTSLQSRIGGGIKSKEIYLSKGIKINSTLMMTYNHDFIEDYNINGNISGNSNSDFKLKTKRIGKDSIALKAGAGFNLNNYLDISAELGTELFKKNYSSIDCSLSFKWKF